MAGREKDCMLASIPRTLDNVNREQKFSRDIYVLCISVFSKKLPALVVNMYIFLDPKNIETGWKGGQVVESASCTSKFSSQYPS